MARAHLYGTPVSPGIALGTVHFLHNEPVPEKRRILPQEVESEQQKLNQALKAVAEDLDQAGLKVPSDMPEYREIIAVQKDMACDPKLVQSTSRLIASERVNAAWALAKVVHDLCEVFRGMEDPYLQDRAQDVRSVGLRILDKLTGADKAAELAPDLILAAEDVSPADIMDLDARRIRGIMTHEGGLTSHTAILARGMHIPALVCVTNLMVAAREGDKVILDGLTGNVLIDPDEHDTSQLSERALRYTNWLAATRDMAHWPADTADAVRVDVLANIERADEAKALAEAGADGVGLYRTEFAFMGETLPDEETLAKEYSKVVQNAQGRVIIRTLDCGADKLMKSQIKEPNPALGLRGVRYTLRNQDLFRVQLRALLRAAAAGHAGRLSVMVPMISTVEEVRAVRRLLQEVDQELSMRHVPHAGTVPLGIMVETPAAMMITDALARECDFFSIGTNDLIHYMLAIDRNNRHVAYLSDAMHPAVVRALKRIIDSGHKAGLSVSACGELSADPFGVVLMLGMGIDALSVSPAFLPGIKHLIRKLDARACMELASQVLMSTDIPACKHMVREMLQKVLGHELSFMTSSSMGE